MNESIRVLGVRVDNFYVQEIKHEIEKILNDAPKQKFITTLNPEILLKAHHDSRYKNILNGADLNICDGFGIRFASLLRKKYIKARFAGVDLADYILRSADIKNLRILIIASKSSLSSPTEIEQAIRRKYPKISARSDFFSTGQNWLENDIIEKAEIVFVNFGAPEQEIFIHENRSKFSGAKILVGVGGTFDFLTGKIRRAPKLLRKIGLEWLWRLIQEPKRWRRIINATIVFPAITLLHKEKRYE